jgi:hypothetical protein
MKLLSQYLDHALKFESLAAGETNPKLKADLSGQAQAYRKLAAERAAKLGLPQPSAPEVARGGPFSYFACGSSQAPKAGDQEPA